MSDLEVLMDLLGCVEDLERELNEYECSIELYRKMRTMVQAWGDQVIDMIDDYEEGEL